MVWDIWVLNAKIKQIQGEPQWIEFALNLNVTWQQLLRKAESWHLPGNDRLKTKIFGKLTSPKDWDLNIHLGLGTYMQSHSSKNQVFEARIRTRNNQEEHLDVIDIFLHNNILCENLNKLQDNAQPGANSADNQFLCFQHMQITVEQISFWSRISGVYVPLSGIP